jgi:CRISPR system Cascade subunit CasC
MSAPLFIQIHTLTSYPAALINRDDVGLAKRIPFGGAVRTRISSQCLKRHWRRHEGEHSLRHLVDGDQKLELAVRSRLSFEKFVRQELLAEGVAEDLATAATDAVMIAVLGESAKAKKAKEDASAAPEEGKASGKGAGKAAKSAKKEEGPTESRTGQVTVLGRPELAYFLAEARELAKAAGTVEGMKDATKARFTKEWGKNLEGLRLAAGIDAALFGRMVTSDKLSRSDAAIHVAHAFTVHKEEAETDYFSAVDDLTSDTEGGGQLGSGHIGTTELTSGLFYSYVVVDVAQLVSNLEGGAASAWREADRALAAQVVHELVHIVARVSPGAKLGSTAPHAYAHLAMVEVGASQPRTLANAFLAPVRARIASEAAGGEHIDLVGATFEAMARYVREVDAMYGLSNRRAVAAIGGGTTLDGLGRAETLDAVAKLAASAVLEGA